MEKPAEKLDTNTPITKRLIISGLTPSITAEDISKRLTTFGTVRAADGFGLPDGLGQPRKYGYVTLETTTGKLAKCMNLLSGSTWKGAKLRFGEAKPDYAERISLENKAAAEEPPKKRRKKHGGSHAEDMSPVTPENAKERGGWKVTALGRITRPVKMRPEHPLPAVTEEKKSTRPKKVPVEGEKKKKKRVKDPDARARRRAIDMTKWGSTHLKGMFLDLEAQGTKRLGANEFDQPLASDEDDTDSEVDKAIEEKQTPELQSRIVENTAGPSTSQARVTVAASSPAPAQIASKPLISVTKAAPLPDDNTNIELEKSQSLNLLNSLFGGKDEDDWVGRESVGSDVDVDELVKGDVMLVDEVDDGIEVVPMDTTVESKTRAEEVHGEDSDEEEEEEEGPSQTQTASRPEPAQTKNLKDLFAPKEAEAGFSLLGHLDLDLELDDEVPYVAEQPIQHTPSRAPAYVAPSPISLPTHPLQAPIVLNPKQALFFPLPPQEHGNSHKARQKDVFDLIKDNGWNWRDPAVGFYRTGTEEDIRRRWEESKGELTREWKRRCREAGKISRRRRGGVEVDNE
ncbi:hypothetical protein B0H34DRAFT_702623 [Crassisporium funariophilum]|nr:hypothetical protein B0H34DRAFT_702623 [Crassisporium funariophilum]